ncbi:hypothetical protein [Acetobacter persici]|uniref:Uncharacterized protein n=1 Tax=Acetobacter persici TaxID=1076596 RepID=A0A1U9LJE8_9PROT|nr:hypothetical protein [Acetobacter persici]AQT06551.1 hypothetical protein A0U91_16215 [Acetobacter persici]
MSETLDADARDQTGKAHRNLRDYLPLWTVYRPNEIEGWRAKLSLRYPEPAPTDVIVHGGCREEVRKLLPSGMTKLMRYPNDPVDVEESWA